MKGVVSAVIVIISMWFMSGCKDFKIPWGNTNELDDHLIVSLRIKILHDDHLELFYRNEDEQFNSDQRITKQVKGSEEYQTVLFVLDHYVFPSHIRIDFGMKESQDSFIIEQLSLKFNDAEHIFTSDEFRQYFRPNPGLQFDFENMSGRGVRYKDKYDPFLVSNNISRYVNRLILY